MEIGGDKSTIGGFHSTQLLGDLMVSSKSGNIDFEGTTIAGSDNNMLAEADKLIQQIAQNVQSDAAPTSGSKFSNIA